MQDYVPAVYSEFDAAAVQATLLFDRLVGKSEILISAFCQVHGLPEALQEAKNDQLGGICEIRGLLTRFGNLLHRFAAVASRLSAPEFLTIASRSADMVPLEGRIDVWIDQIKRNEFSERECLSELDRCVDA